ncbi:hypothetical protein BO70DRAFT_172031 [Aspergillus heteromorphus CBS 117.55]|uniref:Uncharacterized protein n=1 Tax=Aspergillus heteromorphus CBS 117.55 TaxID=1448321 RepID=A0A317V075_9EURO|nr:uncharacterized protein BO70DRAFT_172031 [Aspergillus heteromorphus CBS 117.55]PWY66771.1 hypothetical protein BO70DRAFT_172031 [Aspergillus heteromorphus CBS 117.55]
MNPDEQRAFAFFQDRTVPAFLARVDSSLWHTLVLQMSHAEPRRARRLPRLQETRHATAEGGPCGIPGTPLPWSSRAARLPCSMRGGRHTIPGSPRSPSSAVCCLSSWSGSGASMTTPSGICVRCGLGILNESQTQSPLEPAAGGRRPVEQALVEAFAHWDMQSVQCGVEGPLLHVHEGDTALECHRGAPVLAASGGPLGFKLDCTHGGGDHHLGDAEPLPPE